MDGYNWKYAIPVTFQSDRAKIGNVYVGIASDAPPLRVREQDFGADSPDCHIVMEFENVIGTVQAEMAQELGISELEYERILRLSLQLPSARKLCVFLISALAGTGDRIASLLHEKMVEAMDEIRKQDQDREIF